MHYNYEINNQRWFILVCFVAIIFMPVRINEHLLSTVLYAKVIMSAVLIVFMFLRFNLEIQKEVLIYNISFIGLIVFKKNVPAKRIKRFIFKRVSWFQKCVVVKINKGWNFQVVSKNQDIYKQLQEFAKVNEIDFTKTKDYEYLERRK